MSPSPTTPVAPADPRVPPLTRTVQCRCGPVTRPVAPTRPTMSPAATAAPGFHVDRRQVREHGKHAGAVVDDHRIAGEVEIFREDDPSAAWRGDGGAGRAQEVRAAVRAPGLAVEDAARAEGAVGGLRHRTDEAAVHSFCGTASLQQRAISRLSWAMRACALAGGLTNASSTLSVRVGKLLALTTAGASRGGGAEVPLRPSRCRCRFDIEVDADEHRPGLRIGREGEQPDRTPAPGSPRAGPPATVRTTSSPGCTDRDAAVIVSDAGDPVKRSRALQSGRPPARNRIKKKAIV